MNIVLKIKYINKNRKKDIKKLLSKICFNKTRLQIHSRNSAGRLIFAASDTPVQANNVEYKSWRFKLKNGDEVNKIYSAAYFEVWQPLENADYYLEQCYFHLYKDREEFVLLHSDPNEPDDNYETPEFKKSPHIHIKKAPDPIPHSHFALNTSNLEHIMSSLDNLEEAMLAAIEMINKEIVLNKKQKQ